MGYTGGGSAWDYYSKPKPKTTTTSNKRPGSILGQLQRDQIAGKDVSNNTGWTANTVIPWSDPDPNNNYAGDTPTYPTLPSSPGSGGRGGGGGGGGGGVRPLSQEAFDAMVAAIGRKTPQYEFQQWNPATYQGMEIRPFNDSIYRQAEGALDRGYGHARRQVGEGTANTRRGLNQNWANHLALMGLVPQTVTPRGVGMTSSLGGDQGVMNEAVMNARAQDAAFSNLSAAQNLRAQQGHHSRLNEVNLNDQYYLNQLTTQELADRTGLSLAEARALQEWQQRADDRAYQDSVLAQQWAREASQANWQGGNQANQFNVGLQNERYGDTLGPILEMIGLANQNPDINLDLSALGL